jgi:hypothetical protein
MNLIYGGNYYARFKKIIELIENEKPASILELCFGDTVIANYCKEKNIAWHGIDINNTFVEHAQTKGYKAIYGDILSSTSFIKSDICLISGSLYHFNDEQRIQLFKKIFEATDTFIISEPVNNLSSRKGLIGFIARRSANAGKGHEHFRFNEQTFIAMLEEYKKQISFQYTIAGYVKKDIIVVLKKNGAC